MDHVLVEVITGVVFLLGIISITRLFLRDLDALCEDVANAKFLCRTWTRLKATTRKLAKTIAGLLGEVARLAIAFLRGWDTL
jgi:hypothetical protein